MRSSVARRCDAAAIACFVLRELRGGVGASAVAHERDGAVPSASAQFVAGTIECRPVKPTMPMNAFPPGGPPGMPPGGGGYPPSGGGWGPPPPGGSSGGWGTPPPGGGGYGPPSAAPPPAKKSRTGLYIGLGCGCMVLLSCVIGAIVVATSGSLFGPGEEVVSTPITVGQPFSLTYVQDGSQKYEAWLEVDVDYTAGYNLNGTMLLSENGTAFGQYSLEEDGEGSPVPERNSSTRVSWVTTNLNGNGSASGKVSLFPIPARSGGAQVTISGTIQANPGTTGTIRLFVAKRD